MPLTTNGLTLKEAAVGLGISERKLREHLASIPAIVHTHYGWSALEAFRHRRLLYTETRQHAITTEGGSRIRRHYTIVLVTGEGLAWLQEQLPAITGSSTCNKKSA